MRIGNHEFSEEFLRSMGDNIRVYVTKCEGSIYGTMDYSHVNGNHIGCGTFYKEGADTFMLTAMHVGREADKYHYSMHDRRELKSSPFRGQWLGDRQLENDIAIYGCFSEMIEESTIVPIEENSLLSEVSTNVQGQLFYCQGIPGLDATFLPMMRQFQTVSNPIMGLGLPNDVLEYPDYTFAFQYPRNVKPSGMSGSSVWNTNLHLLNSDVEWSIDTMSFAGVVQKWIPANRCLIVTRADSINNFIPTGRELLRNMWRETPNSDYEK